MKTVLFILVWNFECLVTFINSINMSSIHSPLHLACTDLSKWIYACGKKSSPVYFASWVTEHILVHRLVLSALNSIILLSLLFPSQQQVVHTGLLVLQLLGNFDVFTRKMFLHRMNYGTRFSLSADPVDNGICCSRNDHKEHGTCMHVLNYSCIFIFLGLSLIGVA